MNCRLCNYGSSLETYMINCQWQSGVKEKLRLLQPSLDDFLCQRVKYKASRSWAASWGSTSFLQHHHIPPCFKKSMCTSYACYASSHHHCLGLPVIAIAASQVHFFSLLWLSSNAYDLFWLDGMKMECESSFVWGLVCLTWVLVKKTFGAHKFYFVSFFFLVFLFSCRSFFSNLQVEIFGANNHKKILLCFLFFPVFLCYCQSFLSNLHEDFTNSCHFSLLVMNLFILKVFPIYEIVSEIYRFILKIDNCIKMA